VRPPDILIVTPFARWLFLFTERHKLPLDEEAGFSKPDS